MSRLLLLVLLALPLAGAAQTVYRTTDAQGNTVFTDKPPPGATATQPVEIPPTNTSTPTKMPATPAQAAAPVEEPEEETYSVAIVDPVNETSIPMGPGSFSVSANVDPALAPGYRLQLSIDGTPHGGPQVDASWQLMYVYRGRHDLTVSVVDSANAVVAVSNPVTVYVHRPSKNFKNRKPPPVPTKPTPK